MDWSIGTILWIVIGGTIVGGVARLLLPGRQNIPFWSVVVAGIGGMFIGDWIAELLGVEETFGYDWIRHAIEVAVGIALVVVVAALFGRIRASRSSASTAATLTPSTPAAPPTPPSA